MAQSMKGVQTVKMSLDLYKIRNKVTKLFFWFLFLLPFFFSQFLLNYFKKGRSPIHVKGQFAAAWLGIPFLHNMGSYNPE